MAAATLGGFLGSPLLAQIPRGATTRPAVALPRLMVSNPYAFATSDSVTAVTLGSAMRTRMDRVASGTYNVVSRDQMNQALHEFNYPADAILIPSVQRQFAVAVSARVLLSSSLARTESGRVTVTARLAGLNDDAGSVITVTQAAGQTLDDLGEKIADRFQPVVKANKDAKECIDRRNSDPKKANNAAQDAIRRSELSGLAWYCMAQVALDQQAPADSVIGLLRKAADADPLSLPVLAQLARQYQAKGDTAKLVQTYQEMIVAAPSNEALIKEAFQQFLRAGRVDAARSAVEHAISLDEYNPELYDLLSNVCIFEENNRCAVDALEKLFTIDSTKADSTFFLKITAVA
ncbi:MAG: tetratricopeptide repeat protein, partial [Gemmatimonadales bacterium]